MTKHSPEMKIVNPIKGRPMLHWVGKRPLREVSHFPAQLQEAVSIANPSAEPYYADFIAEKGGNLLFHGDNKEILSSLLVNGFRGTVDLIYIDPPFDSGADYVRKVKLRGAPSGDKIPGEAQSIIEQAQYDDIWANDTYLQFMYERLILMRELLSDRGSIYLHCDWHKSHHLRFLLDEIFGAENFINEIIWHYPDNFQGNVKGLPTNHNNILWYTKSGEFIRHKITIPIGKRIKRPTRVWDKKTQSLQVSRDKKGNIIYKEYEEKAIDDIWQIAQRSVVVPSNKEHLGFPTQKPEALLERIIKASSNEGSIILDCFCGSGTTAAVAEKLGRRWIVADLNRGAIQTTMKRLQEITAGANRVSSAKGVRGFVHYRVNNYDFREQSELRRIAIEKYGVRENRQYSFFDGTANGNLVKIIDLNKPLTKLDIQTIRDELTARPDEERDIIVICSGAEMEIQREIAETGNLKTVNKIIIRDMQKEGVTTFARAEADVHITRDGTTAQVKIADYISPTIMHRLNMEEQLFRPHIGDFRAQVDCVLIDNDYDGTCFHICQSDVPQQKSSLIKGEYEIPLPRIEAIIALKIIDMLGEETLING